MEKDNYFKYTYPMPNWISDAKDMFNKIKKNFNMRFGIDNLMFKEELDKNDDVINLHISTPYNTNKHLSIAYIFDNEKNEMVLKHANNPYHTVITSMEQLEELIKPLLEDNDDSVDESIVIEKFEQFKSESDSEEETCSCGKHDKKDCKCGPKCDCKACKDKYKDSK